MGDMISISPPALSTASWMPLTRYASSAGPANGVSITRTRPAPARRQSDTSVPTTSGLVVVAYSGP